MLGIKASTLFATISKDHNSKIPPVKSFDHFKIVMSVKYKRYRVKNPELMNENRLCSSLL